MLGEGRPQDGVGETLRAAFPGGSGRTEGTSRLSPEKKAPIDDLMFAHSETRVILWRKV